MMCEDLLKIYGKEAEVLTAVNLKIFFFFFKSHSINPVFANLKTKYVYWLVNMFSGLRRY